MPFSQNHLENFDLYHYLYHSHDNGIFFPFCFFMGKSIELLQLCFDLRVFVPFLSNFAWNACFDKFEWRFERGPKVTYGLWTPWLQFERSRFLGPRRPLIEPLSVHPSTRPATIFPESIDELKHCRQASRTPQIVYFLKADDVSYPNSGKIQIQIQRQIQRQRQKKGEPENLV